MDDRRLDDLLDAPAGNRGPVLVLTGAGVSAESGIPTFQGPEGYWRVGSRNYRPIDLATRAAFQAMPDDVWRWYVYRRSVCRGAAPNAAHVALAGLERALGDRFLLVTQNVDGLHLRAGNTWGGPTRSTATSTSCAARAHALRTSSRSRAPPRPRLPAAPAAAAWRARTSPGSTRVGGGISTWKCLAGGRLGNRRVTVRRGHVELDRPRACAINGAGLACGRRRCAFG